MATKKVDTRARADKPTTRYSTTKQKQYKEDSEERSDKADARIRKLPKVKGSDSGEGGYSKKAVSKIYKEEDKKATAKSSTKYKQAKARATSQNKIKDK